MKQRTETAAAGLRRLGVRPSRRRGQSFLQDAQTAAGIADFAGLQPGEPVIEVGPGLGILTAELLRCGADLRAVEIEPALCAELRRALPTLLPDAVCCRDIRTVQIPELFAKPVGLVTVVSNVPYSISTEFVQWLITQRRYLSRTSLLLQREFAERLAASPGCRAYGSLTVLRQLYADAELGFTVPGSAFTPPVAVESRLIRLTFRQPVDVPDGFERVVRAAFSHKRKTLSNSLCASGILGDRDAVTSALQAAGIDGRRRAESLSLDELRRLASCCAAGATASAGK